MSSAAETGQTYVIPARVLPQSQSAATVYVGVCLNGQGPFPFLVDSGSETNVDGALAKRIGLVSPSADVSTSCASGLGVDVKPTSMSIGGLMLDPQDVFVGPLSSPTSTLMGVLGADVLSSFGVARIDFNQQTISLLGPQGINKSTMPGASKGTPPSIPPALLAGTTTKVPLSADTATVPITDPPQFPVWLVDVPITIDGVATKLLIDTGAEGTILSPDLASHAHLVESPITGPGSDGDCSFTFKYFTISTWMIGDHALNPETVASAPGYRGSLGTGTLQQYSPVVLDYDEAELLLGPHSTPGIP